MTKIKKIALTKLLKLELPEFVDDIIRAVSKHNPEGLKLQDHYDMLVEQLPKMALLTAPFGAHPLTKEMHKVHEERLKYSALITMQMRVLHKANLASTKKLVQTAKPVVRLYLNHLRQNNRSIISRTIKGFFLHLNDYPEQRNALDALGFKFYLDELQNTNNLHEEMFMQRLSEKAQNSKVDTAGIQHETQFLLRKLFDQIEFYQYMRKEVDYSPLINQINEIIAQFTSLINMRATCRKTRKRKAETKLVELEEKVSVNEEKSSKVSVSQPTSKINNVECEKEQPIDNVKESDSSFTPVHNTVDRLKPPQGETS